MELKYLKSAARLWNRNYLNKGDLDLSIEALWGLSRSKGSKATSHQSWRFEKKFCRRARRGQSGFEPGRSAEFFFNLQL